MWKFEKVPNIHLEERIDLIYDLKFQDGNGNLDYLHLVRQSSYLTLRNRPGDVTTLGESNKKYHYYLREMIRGFKAYCQEHRALFPCTVIRVPTSRQRLQDPVFKTFFKLFPQALDLSDCLEINTGGEGVEKFKLSRRRLEELRVAEEILIIDDVYSDGNAYASIRNKCGEQKKYIILCPLWFEKDVMHKLMKIDYLDIVKKRLEEQKNA